MDLALASVLGDYEPSSSSISTPSPDPDLLATPEDEKPSKFSVESNLDSALAEASIDQERTSTESSLIAPHDRDASVDSLLKLTTRPYFSHQESTSTLTDQDKGPVSPTLDDELDENPFGPVVENYFELMENAPKVDGTLSKKELEKAVDGLKEQIMVLSPSADKEKRTKMVQQLISYRLRIQELEDLGDKPSGVVAMGHELYRPPMFRSREKFARHCEVCGQLMFFSPGQLECRKCGYLCHERCTGNIARQCVAELIHQKPDLTLDICREKGLSGQNFACAECKKFFPMDHHNVWEVNIRVCDYDGHYYCTVCHRNDTEINPGRAVKNWDLTPRNVCRASKQIITLLYFQPVLPVLEINKELLVQVEEFSHVEDLRSRLTILNRMMMDCREAPQIALLHRLRPTRKHLMTKNGMYSLADLVDINRGVLAKELVSFAADLEWHVRVDCFSCQKLTQVCGYCWNQQDKLYAFDERARVCKTCGMVAHKSCARGTSQCPNCETIMNDKK